MISISLVDYENKTEIEETGFKIISFMSLNCIQDFQRQLRILSKLN
jgi:hypothetical protein